MYIYKDYFLVCVLKNLNRVKEVVGARKVETLSTGGGDYSSSDREGGRVLGWVVRKERSPGGGQTGRLANRSGKQASRQIYALRIITDRHYNNNKDGWKQTHKMAGWRLQGGW